MVDDAELPRVVFAHDAGKIVDPGGVVCLIVTILGESPAEQDMEARADTPLGQMPPGSGRLRSGRREETVLQPGAPPHRDEGREVDGSTGFVSRLDSYLDRAHERMKP